MDNTLKDIGKRIQFHRKNARLTGEELADKAGLTTTYISRVENGIVPGVSLDTILRISKALNIPVSVLIGESEASNDALRALDLLRSILKEEAGVSKGNEKHKKKA